MPSQPPTRPAPRTETAFEHPPARIPAAPSPAARRAMLAIGAILLATLLGAALRLPALDAPSFWADELYSLQGIAEAEPWPIWRILPNAATHLSLYLHGVDLQAMTADQPWQWQQLGVDHHNARLGAAIIGLVSIPLLAAAAWLVAGPRAAAILALLLAAAPWHLEWSQNARFYISLFLLYNLTVALYYHATRAGSTPWLAAAVACWVLAHIHHPPAIFLAPVFALDYILHHRPRLPLALSEKASLWGRSLLDHPPILRPAGWVILGGGFLLCAAMLAWDMLMMPASWQGLAEQPRTHDPATLLAGTAYLLHPALVGFALLSAGALLARRDSRGAYLLLVALVPLGILTALSALDLTFVHVRYGFVALFAWLMLAALGVDRLIDLAGRWQGGAAAAALILTLLLASYFYLHGGHGHRSRWDEAFNHVQHHRLPDQPVHTDFTLAGRYYLQTPDVRPLPQHPDELTTRPAWIVTALTAPDAPPRPPWLDEHATLHAYFDTRIEEPFTSIRVYRIE